MLPSINNDRNSSYTTTRSEIIDMVPSHARHILDVGCSNGALGRALKALYPNCTVYGIEFDPRFAANASNFLDGVVNADLRKLCITPCQGCKKSEFAIKYEA